jgi:2-dehydro-3-deoxygluconokinase
MAGPLDIVAIGEPLMEFSHVERDGSAVYVPGFGGDTSNAAIAAARQGASTGYVTALGDDRFGRAFLDLWDREGVDRSHVLVRKGGRTGIYFIDHDEAGHHFSYLRAGSAASLLAPDEIPGGYLAGTRLIHVSGISQAISASACDAVFEAIRVAREHGVLVSYDTNLRLSLWPLDRARAVITAAMAMADIALPGLDDARQLTGLEAPEDIAGFYLELGCRVVALTMGAEGTLVATPERRERVSPFPVEAIDATGAGDMFDGAFLAEYLRGDDPFAAARYANAAAALSTQGYGAVAPMPRRAEVEAFVAGRGQAEAER